MAAKHPHCHRCARKFGKKTPSGAKPISFTSSEQTATPRQCHSSNGSEHRFDTGRRALQKWMELYLGTPSTNFFVAKVDVSETPMAELQAALLRVAATDPWLWYLLHRLHARFLWRPRLRGSCGIPLHPQVLLRAGRSGRCCVRKEHN